MTPRASNKRESEGVKKFAFPVVKEEPETQDDGSLRKEELEKLLLERTETLEECKDAFDALQQEVLDLQNENDNMAAELINAQKLFDELETRIAE